MRLQHTKKQREIIKHAFIGVDRDALVKDLKTSRNTIDQTACGALVVSWKRAQDIEKHTKHKVKASILRPDIFCNS